MSTKFGTSRPAALSQERGSSSATKSTEHQEKRKFVLDEDKLNESMIVPRLQIANVRKRNKVENELRGLCLTSVNVRRILSLFFTEMRRGLARNPPQPSSLQMENTYIPELPDGTEDGQYLALDLGGTNARVILLELSHGRIEREIVSHFSVPEPLRFGSGQHLFDHLAKCIYEFVCERNLLDQHLSLGFTFSFPVRQHAIDCGVLVTWTKSFNCPSAVGKDVVAMLREAIQRRGDLKVEVRAVLNDSSGTLLQGALEDSRTAIGLIIATGTNACYLEKADRIEKWEGERHGEREVIIDIEWGAFGDNGILDFLKTPFDREVDKTSVMVNSFTFEKYISGKYLGELVRCILVKLVAEGVLFQGKATQQLFTVGSFTTTHVSHIECDSLGLKTRNTMEILTKMGLSFTDDDVTIVKHVCHIVSLRAAILLASCIAGLLMWMDRDDCTIATDGSLFKFHPRLRFLMETYISLLVPGKKFRFLLTEDGSGKGACLLAAVAQKIQNRRTKK